VRAQQLQIREKKAAKQVLHEIHSHQKLAKDFE